MSIDIGVCAKPETIAAVPEGLDYLECTVGDLLVPDQDDDAFGLRLRAAEETGLEVRAVNCLFPGRIKTTGPEVDTAAVDTWLATVCRRAARAGVTYIVYGSGGSRAVPDGFSFEKARDQLVDHLLRFGPVAAEAGVTIVLEPLNQGECNIVTTVREGADIVREVNHPHIRLLADTYHMAVDREDPQAIRDAHQLIEHAHCAEAAGRKPVGTAEDHRPYFRALKDISYRRGISIEAKWDDFSAQLPDAVADLRRQIEEA